MERDSNTLTTEQSEIIKVAEAGHYILVTGQAGTGKSTLVRALQKDLCRKGRKVAIVCSSGITGSVYLRDGTTVSTAHAFYSLCTANMVVNMVVERSVANNLVCERSREADTLIWDEINMTSRRVFELANKIHELLSSHSESKYLFGRKQVILVGDFLQLRPVANFFDLGRFVFDSPPFMKSIPHRYELKMLLRQNENEKEFVACLREVRMGKCSDISHAFIKSLARPLSDEVKETATHIFFKRLPVQFFNSQVLFMLLPGDLFTFEAIDEGDVSGIQCPADRVLLLEPGCKVMLLWNKSNSLVNGSQGTFVGVRGDDVVVDFADEGHVVVKKETWTNTSRTGNAIGSRTQVPQTLMYAITCHKSQGFNLPAVVLHSSKEFVPGLMYVSLTRVKSCNNLQIISFNPNQLLQPIPECVNVCAAHSEPLDGEIGCCRNKVLDDEDSRITDGCDLPNMDANGYDILEVSSQTENLVKSYFERGEPDELVIDLQTVFMVLSNEASNDFCRCPPQSLSLSSLLEKMKKADPLSDFATEKNGLIEEVINENPHKETFGKILWSRACQIILEDSLENLDKVTISTALWSSDTRELYMMITRSPDYLRDLEMFFSTKPFNRLQSTVGACMMTETYKEVVKCVADKVHIVSISEPGAFDVKSMFSEGLAKVRHVGAWAIRRVVRDHQKYVQSNLVTKNRSTHDSVFRRMQIASLLEEHLVGNYDP